jgi:hypothetical protein
LLSKLDTFTVEKKKLYKKPLFIADDIGFPINALAWNEAQLNLSAGIYLTGYVEFKNDKWKSISELVSTNGKYYTTDYKNYGIIENGLVSTSKIPVSLSKDTFDLLQKNEVISQDEAFEENKIYILDLSELPVVNKRMSSKEFEIKDVCTIAENIEHNKAQLAMYKKMLGRLVDKKDEDKKLLEEIYGEK